MDTYPICLVDLGRRRVVVVGSGRVAERKLGGLLAAGAAVNVVGPRPTKQILAWAGSGAITLSARRYQDGDLAGAFLVVAATDDSAVNQAVCDEARRRGCLVNAVEHPERSDFIVPAVVRRGEVTIAIGTGGASPALARHLRRRVEQAIGAEYAAAAAVLAELRPVLAERFPDADARTAAVERLLAAGLLDVAQEEGQAAAAWALAEWDAEAAEATAGGDRPDQSDRREIDESE